MEYITAAYSDPGISEKRNQDSCCIYEATTVRGNAVLAVLCDGMGGLQQGELASATVVKAFGDWFTDHLPELLKRDDVFAGVREQWSALLEQLNIRILNYSRRAGYAIGTTFTGVLLLGDHWLVASLGDSRIYEHNGRELRQITHDHSLVAREVAQGHLTEDEARQHPRRNILLQCIGVAEKIAPDFFEDRPRGGTVYLICSDGFVHTFSREELKAELEPCRLQDRTALTNVLIRLTEEMKRRGENDNITSVLIRSEESRQPQNKKKRGLAAMVEQLKGGEPPEPQRPFFQLTNSCVSSASAEIIGDM